MNLVKIILFIIFGSFIQLANSADPVTINISGNIIASPCEISTDSATVNIELGENLKASDGVNAGASISPHITSQIKLINCPAGTS